MIIMEKRCSKCGEVKPIEEFGHRKNSSDGLDSWCKKCYAVSVKKYYTKHNKKVRTYRRKYYYEHHEQSLKSAKEWRKNHPDKAKETKAIWRAANPEKVGAYAAKWGNANPEKRRAHRALNWAIRKGRIVPQPCEICGENKAVAHHNDYSKPLIVNWLCHIHHQKIHLENKQNAIAV